MDKDLFPVICSALNGLSRRPQKLRGQNFLVSRGIVKQIADIDTLCDDGLPRLEIGAGLASLSEILAEKPGRLDLLEIEPAFAGRLALLFADRPQTFIHNADALLFDYIGNYGDAPYIIYGNIPYNITSPLLQHLLTCGGNWQTMILMMQKEAAQRLCDGKGRDNGPLTLMLEYFGLAEICLEVARDAFYPVPAVDSAVIRIKRKEGAVNDKAFRELFAFIKAAFSLRRKTMVNSLSAAYPHFPREYWQSLLEEYGLSINERAESCSLKQFSELFDLHTSRLFHPAVQQQ